MALALFLFVFLLLFVVPTAGPRVEGQNGPEVIVCVPVVLCLDEFLETEDPRVRKGVERSCARLCAAGVTIVFATHVMGHVEGMMEASSVQPPGTGCREGGRMRAAKNGGLGRVVAFTRGQAGDVSRADECAYVRWKKKDAADRRGRVII